MLNNFIKKKMDMSWIVDDQSYQCSALFFQSLEGLELELYVDIDNCEYF